MEIILLARNVKQNGTAPKVKLIFHPMPLILDCLIRFSEITVLFEFKSHMKYNAIQWRKNNINIIFILSHLTKMATIPIYGKTKYV